MADKKKLVKTEIGFTCKVDESALDDIRIFESVRKVENGTTEEKLYASMDLIDAVLGAEQKEKLYKFLEEKEGKATISRVTEVLADIFEKIGEAKKK